jgi:hypothetical protein
MKYVARSLFALVLTLPFAHLAVAHFKMIEPESWIVESDLGDPQKAAPCGTSEKTSGTPTNKIGSVKGGTKLHLKIQETVYHPGYYRVALSVNSRAELPKDPDAVTAQGARGLQSVAGAISYPPRPPILADGLFMHVDNAPARGQRLAPWEADIDIPNINCAKCTMQVIQFMAAHGLNAEGDYSYHHCADLQITADPAKPMATGWPAQK